MTPTTWLESKGASDVNEMVESVPANCYWWLKQAYFSGIRQALTLKQIEHRQAASITGDGETVNQLHLRRPCDQLCPRATCLCIAKRLAGELCTGTYEPQYTRDSNQTKEIVQTQKEIKCSVALFTSQLVLG